MYARRERRVPGTEHKRPTPISAPPDWEAIRLFLEVTRQGSFRSASELLGLSVNALRRRINELESDLGVKLLTRHVDGVRATAEGEHILAAAQRMEQASFGLVRARDQIEPAIAGEVRLAVTEGLGTFWVVPRLVEFQRSYPRLLVDISCAMQSADVLRLEADVAIQLTRPTAKDLKVVKIGRLHVMPFVAKSYLDVYGCPQTVEDLLNHRIVLQLADQVAAQADYNEIFAGVPQPGFVAIRSNVSSTHYWAIAKGAGLGLLPTYAQAISARVVPVDLPLRMQCDIWLTYHSDANKIPRVRRLIEWIMKSFDPEKYPWFRDDFVHPRDFPKDFGGKPLVSLFEGFFGADDVTETRFSSGSTDSDSD
ncbi:LysR family transcriptional regulator [Blastochloris viridis]|uniref:Gcv operon activator n=1 Tax=Blastochloris viridis TaxID=1079 RepID=A0A0H5BE30_BLAVI|nr:LysR family transcriptional regulator [Blastochloris viridis]ALK09659.1 Glycine cleavage system transcriptional activator [Blastochloris viridis]BAS00453.1 transcriptional regulator [Blastochloris viridis]CUU42322.1 Gcv operon activator [Blastochloris viridis]